MSNPWTNSEVGRAVLAVNQSLFTSLRVDAKYRHRGWKQSTAGHTTLIKSLAFFLQVSTYSHCTLLHLSWHFSVLVGYKRLTTSINPNPSCSCNYRNTVYAILVINQGQHPSARCCLISNHLFPTFLACWISFRPTGSSHDDLIRWSSVASPTKAL